MTTMSTITWLRACPEALFWNVDRSRDVNDTSQQRNHHFSLTTGHQEELFKASCPLRFQFFQFYKLSLPVYYAYPSQISATSITWVEKNTVFPPHVVLIIRRYEADRV